MLEHPPERSGIAAAPASRDLVGDSSPTPPKDRRVLVSVDSAPVRAGCLPELSDAGRRRALPQAKHLRLQELEHRSGAHERHVVRSEQLLEISKPLPRSLGITVDQLGELRDPLR